tara:strand:+ start:1717 stop:2391 length:675 start_codon:yes stop_codon:yes gene_type:complete
MKNWTDAYGRWHDKPTDGDRPSSNNGYIYSAYAHKLDLLKNISSINECYQKSIVNINNVNFNRHPDIWQTENTAPPSRDEVIGLISLGLLNANYLKNNHWCFWIDGKPLEDIDWFNTIIEMLKLAGKHRNEVWTGEYPDAKQLAFRLNFHDRFYVKYMAGMKTTTEEEMLWSYYVDDMKKTNNWSAKNICILQMSDIGLDISHMNKPKSYNKYFQKEHPFLKVI